MTTMISTMTMERDTDMEDLTLNVNGSELPVATPGTAACVLVVNEPACDPVVYLFSTEAEAEEVAVAYIEEYVAEYEGLEDLQEAWANAETNEDKCDMWLSWIDDNACEEWMSFYITNKIVDGE